VINYHSFGGDANSMLEQEDNKNYVFRPHTYSSLVDSFAFQKIIKDMFCHGQIPSFNQIVLDISKGLIHPTPGTTIGRNSKDDLEEKIEQEKPSGNKSDAENLINRKKYSGEDNSLDAHQDLNSTIETSNPSKNNDDLNVENQEIRQDKLLPVQEEEIDSAKPIASSSNGLSEDTIISKQDIELLPVEQSEAKSSGNSSMVVHDPNNIILKQQEISNQRNGQIVKIDNGNFVNIPGYIIKEIENEILSNQKDLPLSDLAVNLSAILSNHIQEKDEDKFAMIEELRKYGKDKDYINFISKMKDLNSDVQDIIDTYGASQDRLDLKNTFKDQLRSICKQYYERESYRNAPELSIKDLVGKIEIQERNISLNILRISLYQDFIIKKIGQNTLTPCLLSHIICQLRCGDLIISNVSRIDKKDLEKLRKFQLSSPYEEPIELLLFRLESIASKYSQIRTGFFNIGWFGRNKLKPFQDELLKAIEEYIQRSSLDIQSRKNSSSKSLDV
jgi:hypothetical protein